MHNGVNNIENLSNMNDYLFQSLKRNTDSHQNLLSRNMSLPIGDAKSRADSSFQPDKKRSRNIGSKSKRLLIENQDALDLKYTWEELQDMLNPPTMHPSTVTIEDHEFEEYEVSAIYIYIYINIFSIICIKFFISLLILFVVGTSCFWKREYIHRSVIRVII